MEAVRVERSALIDQPIDKVFGYLRNLRNFPQWRLGVLYVKQLTRGSMGIGTKVKLKRMFLGQLFDATIVVTEYEPDSSICLSTTSGPLLYEGCYTLEPHTYESGKVGTRITFAYEFEPSDFFFLNVKESVFVPALKIDVEASLNLLKEILEA